MYDGVLNVAAEHPDDTPLAVDWPNTLSALAPLALLATFAKRNTLC